MGNSILEIPMSGKVVGLVDTAEKIWMAKITKRKLTYRCDRITYGMLGWAEVEIKLPPGQWSIVGIGSQLNEDMWNGIVERLRDSKGFDGYKNYSEWFTVFEENFNTATESGLSLLAAQGKKPSTTLIIIKNE